MATKLDLSFLAAKVKKETQMVIQLFTKYKYPQLKRKGIIYSPYILFLYWAQFYFEQTWS